MMKNNRILVVDDNDKNIQVIASLLTENHYNVEYAINGLDALALMSSEDFDLILLDIMMPKMDGYEVCNKIKEDNAHSEIPIIFLTARTDVESIKKAFEYGALDYISKPFSNDELLARVKTHLELKNIKEELREVNRGLEKKVLARTAELDQANKKLVAIDTAKSQFINIISHEIRTPLNGIIGGLSLLKDCELTEETASLFDILDVSAKRLEDFSKKALDISLFNSYDKEMLKLEKTNINEVLTGLIQSKEWMNTGKKINFVKAFNSSSTVFFVDPQYIQKCVYNIIDNAVKFSPINGQITIATLEKDTHLIITVKDEGIGFDKGFTISDIKTFDNKEHFDENPGLGLYLSNQIVKAHDGYLENGNNTDKGAYLNICIPIK
jgi:two-component system sensor histidine kinase/response regulator